MGAQDLIGWAAEITGHWTAPLNVFKILFLTFRKSEKVSKMCVYLFKSTRQYLKRVDKMTPPPPAMDSRTFKSVQAVFHGWFEPHFLIKSL